MLSYLLRTDAATVVTKHLEIELSNVQEINNHYTGPSSEILKWSIDKTRKICHKNAFLYLICSHFKPKTVVETGVATGASSAYILSALKDTGWGHLYSIDLPNVEYTHPKEGVIHNDNLPKQAQSGFAIPQNLRRNWSLTLGDSRVELPNLLKKLGHVDFFFHDSLHTYDAMLFEYETVWPYLTKGGVLVSDDVTWNGAFDKFIKKNNLSGQVYHDRGLLLKSG